MTNIENLTRTERPVNTTIPQKANIFKVEEKYYTDSEKLSRQINLSKGDNRNSGISLPKAVMTRIDAVKHPDIPRSKFVLRILEAVLIQKEMEEIR